MTAVKIHAACFVFARFWILTSALSPAILMALFSCSFSVRPWLIAWSRKICQRRFIPLHSSSFILTLEAAFHYRVTATNRLARWAFSPPVFQPTCTLSTTVLLQRAALRGERSVLLRLSPHAYFPLPCYCNEQPWAVSVQSCVSAHMHTYPTEQRSLRLHLALSQLPRAENIRVLKPGYSEVDYEVNLVLANLTLCSPSILILIFSFSTNECTYK
jgi:hypothetical protein